MKLAPRGLNLNCYGSIEHAMNKTDIRSVLIPGTVQTKACDVTFGIPKN